MESIDWIFEGIRDIVRSVPQNSLSPSGAEKAWDDPVVEFAAGDDPLFAFFKKDIGDFYWTPGEAFDRVFPESAAAKAATSSVPASQGAPGALSVVSWVVPQTARTKEEQRKHKKLPAERWIRSRADWPNFTSVVHERVIELFTDRGIRAVAPEMIEEWQVKQSGKYGYASRWSQRHTAYVAGLGTFGLCDGLITAVGKAIRAGSVVVEMELPPTSRPYLNHHDYCLHYVDGSCGECITRCPAGAISKRGHDKIRCREYIRDIVQPYASSYVGDASSGCGLCQSGVACESGIPVGLSAGIPPDGESRNGVAADS